MRSYATIFSRKCHFGDAPIPRFYDCCQLYFFVFNVPFIDYMVLDSQLQPICNNCPVCLGSCKPEGMKKFSMVEHASQAVVVPAESLFYSPAGFQDQAGEVYKGLNKTLKFHTDDGKTQRAIWHHHSIPGFQVPGQGGDYHIGPVCI